MNHSERKHSIYSPSAFSRWASCSASAQFTADMESEDSPASLRGTWMHERVEEELTGKEFNDQNSEFNTVDNWKDIDRVVAYVRELASHCSLLETAEVWHERRLEHDHHPEVFGTSDLIIYDKFEDRLYIVDYKFGNTLVSAKDNGQMLMYARLVMSQEFMKTHNVEHISMMIIQPASPSFTSVETLSYDDWWDWYENTWQQAYSDASSKYATFLPSADNCHWCPASGRCPSQKQAAMDVFDNDGTNLAPGDDDYSSLLPKVAMMEEFIKGVRAQALAVLKAGNRIEGYKLVESSKNRTWVDPEKTERWLTARKIPKDQRTVTKVIGIKQAEALVRPLIKDNPRLQKNFGALLHKPKGHPVIALEDDNRPAISVTNPLIDGDLI